MKQILCVVDFAEPAGTLIEVAARIASACQAHLMVLYPYRLIGEGFDGDMPSLKRKIETAAKEKFELIVKHLPYKNLSYEFVSEIGFKADRIQAHLKRNSTDMVVVGQQQSLGKHDLSNFNLQQLIQSSRLPFVIVPSEVKVETVLEPNAGG